MPSRQVYVPDDMIKIWNEVPNKSALVRAALERWQARHQPKKRVVIVGYFFDHHEFIVDDVIVNIPDKTSLITIKQAYHPRAKREDYFLQFKDKLHPSVIEGIEHSENWINWDELISE